MTATMTEAAPNGLRPWREKPAGLTEGQAAVWDELERRGLDIREYVSWTQKQAIGVQLRISAGAVQQQMQTIAKKIGLKLPKASEGVAAALPEASPTPQTTWTAAPPAAEADDLPPVDSAAEIRPGGAGTETEAPQESEPALAPGQMFADLVADTERLRRDRDETARMLAEVQRERDELSAGHERLRGDLTRLRGDYEEAGQTIERLRDEADLLARERDEALREPAAEAEPLAAEPLNEEERMLALLLANDAMFAGMRLERRLEVVLLAAQILAVAVEGGVTQ